METSTTEINLYNKRERVSGIINVEQLSENTFRMVDNDIINCDLTYRTEFETRINKEGKHEVVRILKKPDFITRRFWLSSKYKTPDYKMLAEELVKHGGFWQVDFGGIATINIPKDFPFDVDKVMKDLDINLSEIV